MGAQFGPFWQFMTNAMRQVVAFCRDAADPIVSTTTQYGVLLPVYYSCGALLSVTSGL